MMLSLLKERRVSFTPSDQCSKYIKTNYCDYIYYDSIVHVYMYMIVHVHLHTVGLIKKFPFRFRSTPVQWYTVFQATAQQRSINATARKRLLRFHIPYRFRTVLHESDV